MKMLKFDKLCLFFILYIALLASCLGLMLSSMATEFRIPTFALWAVGAALAPAFLGFWTLLLSVVYPAWKPSQLTWIPLCMSMIGGVSLLAMKPYPLPHMVLSAENIVALCLLIVTLVAGSAMFLAYARSFNVQHDSNVYLDMARYITETRNIRSLYNLTTAFPNFVGEPHGVAYQGYLAFAQNFLSEATISEKHCLLNVAQQWNNVCYLLAMFGVALGISGNFWVAAVVTMLAFVPRDFQYAASAFSRDSYRITLALCFIFFLSNAPMNADTTNIAYYAIALGFLCYMTGDAHALNVILIVCFFLAMLFALVYPGKYAANSKEIFIIFCSCCAGILFSLRKYLYSYVKTKKVQANTWRSAAFSGTKHEKYIKKAFQHRLPPGVDSVYKNMNHVFKADMFVFNIGCVSAFLLCICSLFFEIDFGIKFVAFVTLAALLPFTGLLDVGPYQISKYFISNIRYPLHCYPFLMLSAVCVIDFIAALVPEGSWRLLLITIVMATAYYCAIRTFCKWRFSYLSYSDTFELHLMLFKTLESKASWDGAVAVTNTGFPMPFLTHKVAYLFSEIYFALLRADTPDLAEYLIQKRKIAFFVLSTIDIERLRLKITPLYKALEKYHNKIYSNGEFEVWQ